MSDANDDLLSYADIAGLTGLTEATLRGYRAAGRMPAPDAPLADRPRWRRKTITTWLTIGRPGKGAPGRPRRPRSTKEAQR